ncbi:MAG: GNAT family N-acetyltransferase [Anaerolineae bacterium]|nr:GNAT family N-acetyltransferase [Anaerolineae bacterium]
MLDSIDESVTVPDAPALPGLAFRHFRGPSDYAALAAVGNDSREADDKEWVVSVEGLAAEFDHPLNMDPRRDMVIATIDGEMIGFGRGRWSVDVSGLYRYMLEVELLPERRGHGLRRALLHWLEAHMRPVAAEHPATAEKVFRVMAPETAAGMTALLRSEGYEPVRAYDLMTRSLEGPLPDFPMPPGLELRPVLPEHYRAIWDASQEAFRDHWGKSVHPENAYQLFLSDPVTFTPQLWQVAWDTTTNEIAGQVRTFIDPFENERLNRRLGYTESISVRRPYRRRGLARAMIAESLRVLKAQGMTESALNVDSQNLSGAVRLYEDCGFRPAHRTLAYHKPLNTERGETSA